MLKLFKYERNRFLEYAPSAQSHCSPIEVEEWMLAAADDAGQIKNLSIEIHGTKIPLSHAMEVYVVAALYAADHNDYVSRNFGFGPELSTCSDDPSDIEREDGTDDEKSLELLKLEEDYEQNEDLEVNKFGPSHAEHTDW
jgi:hypothetical protein